jgi:hypothetical protein
MVDDALAEATPRSGDPKVVEVFLKVMKSESA